MKSRIILPSLSACVLVLLLFNSGFAQSDKKTAYAVLIDNTGSLRAQFPAVTLFAKGIVERLHQRGPISLFNFQTQGTAPKQVAVTAPGIEWSQDKSQLNNYIDSLSIVPGQTALMDAINSMAEHMDNLNGQSFGDKFLVLITDGEERKSVIKEKQLINELKRRGIRIYAVGLTGELELDNGGALRLSSRDRAETFLKKLTKETGGRVVFPNSKKVNVDSVLNNLFAR